MQIFKTHWFDHWARKQDLTDPALCQAVQEMQQGLYEADLGGGLLKKRIAKAGQGKSGGFRTLIASNKGDLWFFMFGFEKNARSNINAKEQAALKRLADELLHYPPPVLETLQREQELIRVECHEKKPIRHS